MNPDKEDTITKATVAKRLFRYHTNLHSDEEMEKEWAKLPQERDWGCPYTVCRREYFRMAKGVLDLLGNPTEEAP